MKICLLIPPSEKRNKIPERVYGCSFSLYPQQELPMLYCAAVLEQDGHEITFKDFPNLDNSWNSFLSFLGKAQFDAYIFHTVLLSESQDLRAAAQVRKYAAGVPIIFFGPQPTLLPERFLKDDGFYVVRAEPEIVICNLIKALEGKTAFNIPGISYIKENRVAHTDTFGIIEDLDKIPFPARHYLGPLKYKYYNPKLRNKPVALLLASRGCAFRCYFCVPNSISWAREIEWRRYHNNEKPPVKIRSAENVIAEFRDIKSQGYNAVAVIDDMFLWGGKQRIIEICAGISGVGIEFGILARTDQINDEDIIRALALCGCRYVDLGVEALDKKVLDYAHKDLDPKTITESIALLNKYGIEPKLNIMLGVCPYETKQSIAQTINTVCKLPVRHAMFSIATPFPGTDFYSRAQKEGWISSENLVNLEQSLDPAKKALVGYPGLARRDLEKLIKWANRRFYLRPQKIMQQLEGVRGVRDLINLAKSGFRLIK